MSAKTSDDGTNDFSDTSVEQHLSSTHSFDQPESRDTSDKGDHACEDMSEGGWARQFTRPTQDELNLIRVETSVGLGKEGSTVEVVD
jgi:hypothetical protein